MSAQATLEIRKEELRRRVEALPSEVTEWKARTINDLDSNLHWSQLQAIGILTNELAKEQESLLGALDPNGDTATFHDKALELVESIIRSQRTWDFFRSKLDLRYSPTFKEILWVADTVVWDCYRPVLDTAADLGILQRTDLREPPLTYLTAEFSPATYTRGSRPYHGREYFLGRYELPIPVIELPWDHVENVWELLTLYHEVGHDLEADMQLGPVLAASLQTALSNNGVPEGRIQQWLVWQGEVFADLVGLQLGGPAFAEALMHLLLLPASMVTTIDESDPHPTRYPRILMNTAYIPTMISGNQQLADHGHKIADRWVAVYGQQPQFDTVLGDFPFVFPALMDQPLPELKGKTVRELLPYKAADDQRIRSAAGYMRTGMNKPGKLQPRHCISAARMAVTQAALAGALSGVLDNINQRTMALVKSNAPGGLRGGDTSTPHKKFIASFVKGL
jgi:hypothetical protein